MILANSTAVIGGENFDSSTTVKYKLTMYSNNVALQTINQDSQVGQDPCKVDKNSISCLFSPYAVPNIYCSAALVFKDGYQAFINTSIMPHG